MSGGGMPIEGSPAAGATTLIRPPPAPPGLSSAAG